MVKGRETFSKRRFLVGRAGPFPRLIFREDVMLRLDQFSHLRTRGEHGGFLIGKVRELKSSERYEIFVERFVPIPQRDDATRLVINQEHLVTVQRALEDGGQGEEIVGWAHTHPGFGVFLSSFDKEQHKRFFPKPWQIAYVIDNLAQERAVYSQSEGEWRQLEGYYILKDMAENEMAITGASTAVRWSRLAFLVLLLFFIIGVASYSISLLRPFGLTKNGENQTQDLEFPLEEEPIVIVERKEPQARTVEQVGESTKVQPTIPPYTEYVVQRGDNLWKIAEKLWGDPNLYHALAEINNISNPGVIQVGTVLQVPPQPE